MILAERVTQGTGDGCVGMLLAYQLCKGVSSNVLRYTVVHVHSGQAVGVARLWLV